MIPAEIDRRFLYHEIQQVMETIIGRDRGVEEGIGENCSIFRGMKTG